MKLRTIIESTNLLSIDTSQAPNKCQYCNKSFDSQDLRPYGKDGTWICFECGMEPENLADTEAAFNAVLSGDDIDGVNMVTIGENHESSLAIDFDCTIHSYTSGYQPNRFDDPVNGAIQALSQLADQYSKIYVFTARDILHPVERWLKEEFRKANITYPSNIEITNIKPKADIYIDDKGYQFNGDWVKTMEDIQKYKTWVSEHRLPTFMESYAMANNVQKEGR
jgi:hypothetical protein